MARGAAETEDGLQSEYVNFYHRIQKANAEAQRIVHALVLDVNPALILIRRWPRDYPSEKQIMELSGKDGGPLSVQTGINVVIESSSPGGPAAAKLTPFYDEREISPWFGRDDLSTDAQGYSYEQHSIRVQAPGSLRDRTSLQSAAPDSARRSGRRSEDVRGDHRTRNAFLHRHGKAAVAYSQGDPGTCGKPPPRQRSTGK